jgi:hypothetical protein
VFLRVSCFLICSAQSVFLLGLLSEGPGTHSNFQVRRRAWGRRTTSVVHSRVDPVRFQLLRRKTAGVQLGNFSLVRSGLNLEVWVCDQRCLLLVIHHFLFGGERNTHDDQTSLMASWLVVRQGREGHPKQSKPLFFVLEFALEHCVTPL